MCEREAPCLAPTVLNTSTSKCEPPENLTITLYGGTTTEPGISLPFIAAVTNQDNQPPKNPVTVKISLKVDPTSGGHDHGTSDRPRGGIAGKSVCESDDTCWSQESPANNGAVVFNFNPTETSGKHTISATCDGCTNNPQTATVNVKVDGLKPIPPSGLYALYETDGSVIGAVKDRHESNHYLTPTAAIRLLVLAINYHHLHPNDPVLHVNDASLMWGGKFDIAGKWSGYHYEHDRGVVVDIRANTTVGNIPETNFIDFENMATGQGLDAQLHCSPTRDPSIDNCVGDINRHYHVILN